MAAIPMQEIPTITGTQAQEFITRATSHDTVAVTDQQIAIYTQLTNTSKAN